VLTAALIVTLCAAVVAVAGAVSRMRDG